MKLYFTETCPICFNSFKEAEVHALNCGHIYCKECFDHIQLCCICRVKKNEVQNTKITKPPTPLKHWGNYWGLLLAVNAFNDFFFNLLNVNGRWK